MGRPQLKECIRSFFEYESPKVVVLGNLKYGILQRVIQFIIFIYILCWIMIYEKGYQDHDEAITAVTTKVKGISLAPESGEAQREVFRVWDIQDLLIPALEDRAIFLTTRLLETRGQTISKCPEEKYIQSAYCESDKQCVEGDIDHLGHGVRTGKCVIKPGATNGTCEIFSWCPVEGDESAITHEYFFPMVTNYTVFIKCDIAFEKFNVKRRNILDWITSDFLEACRYNKNDPKLKFCPIFKLEDIFQEAGYDEHMLTKGGVIRISVEWKCDLDWSLDYCTPEYSFTNLGAPTSELAPGFNVRYSKYYYENGTRYRNLFKAYGIRFVIDVVGHASRFDLLPFTMNIGSGIGWLSVAPLICDFVAFTLSRAGVIYDRVRVELISLEQEKQWLEELKNQQEPAAE